MDNRKTIKVVAAIIRKGDKIFATQRGYGNFKDKWEFPGGKVEDNEQPEDALIREIKEELAADIKIKRFMTTVEYDYPDFHLSMDCFEAELEDGSQLTLNEHEAFRWLGINELDQVDWLQADRIVIDNMITMNQ